MREQILYCAYNYYELYVKFYDVNIIRDRPLMNYNLSIKNAILFRTLHNSSMRVGS